MNPLNQSNQMPNINSLFSKFMQNPVQALTQSGFKITGNANSPQAIINQLLSTGQITQEQLNNAQARASQFFR